MKFKVGDKVRLRSGLEVDRNYGVIYYSAAMGTTLCGIELSVAAYVSRDNTYQVTLARSNGFSRCWWVTEEMLEPANAPDTNVGTNVGTSDNYDDEIIGIMRRQTEKGMEKYGAPLNENTTLTATQRIEHYQEEMVDGLRYAEHLKQCLKDNLTVNDYQRAALRTSGEYDSDWNQLRNAVYGLNGEAGECIDILKKCEFQGHAFDRDHMIEELGDVAWYLPLAAGALGITLEEILQRNIEKLKRRYPDGFDKDRSIHREENNEKA